MGAISDFLKSQGKGVAPNPNLPPAARAGNRRAVSLWNEVFGVDKEKTADQKPGYGHKPFPGGSYGRSVAGGEASFIRLLQAMRSMAPGGWSDDRWEQTTRHFTGITYAAVNRICTQLQRSEFQVFKRDRHHPDGKRPVREDEEAWELVRLLEVPNPQDSFGDMMYRWGQQTRLTGSALTWMVPNAFGKPYELYPIPTAIAIPQPAVNPDYPDGYYRIQPVYPYGPFSSYPTPTTAVGAAIGAQWMMKWMYPHPLLRYDGYSPQTAARLEMDSFEMINRARFYGMKRGIHPSAVLNFDEVEGMEPLPEPEIERIKADFENEQMGPENTGRLFVAAPGSHLEQWGTPPRDMAYETGWDQLADFIMGAVYGITKPAAGMVDEASYATLYATLKQLHLITLEPECTMISSKLTRWLGKFWGDDIIVEVRTPRIDDHDLKLAILNALMSAKAITKNEFRKELEMPIWHDARGEEIAGTEPLPPPMPGMGMPMDPSMAAMGPTDPNMPPGFVSEELGESGEPMEQGQPMEEEAVPQDDSLESLLLMDGNEIDGEDYGLTRPDEDETKIKREQPVPGKLSRGSKGPAKRLSEYFVKNADSMRYINKSLYERIREVVKNGH